MNTMIDYDLILTRDYFITGHKDSLLECPTGHFKWSVSQVPQYWDHSPPIFRGSLDTIPAALCPHCNQPGRIVG